MSPTQSRGRGARRNRGTRTGVRAAEAESLTHTTLGEYALDAATARTTDELRVAVATGAGFSERAVRCRYGAWDNTTAST